jgi:hypothetical protein
MYAAGLVTCDLAAERNSVTAKPQKAKDPTAYRKIVAVIAKHSLLAKKWMIKLRNAPLICI